MIASTANYSRKLASYYTRIEIAQVLTDWAIAEPDTRVLDPSFGGCAFLRSALKTLRGLESPGPAKQIYGVDIDPNARPYLKDLVAAGADPDQFLIRDFFSIDPHNLADELFDAVVGNPPYIRHHDIPKEAQERAIERLREFDMQISKRASYWAYFLLYSMQFLDRDGRLAMILPGAFLHTDYSGQVRELLRGSFAEVTLILLQERIFDDTEEESVLVCASGAWRPHRAFRIGSARNIADAARVFLDLRRSTRTVKHSLLDGNLLRGLLTPKTLDTYDKLLTGTDVIRLGDWIEVRLGVVTGKNAFFILSSGEQEEQGIPIEFFVPIVRRSSYLKGLWLEDNDMEPLTRTGRKHLLLRTDLNKTLLPESLQNYLEHGEAVGVSQGYKCRVRSPWYAVRRTFVPPAFVQCMSASWPRLVVNRSVYTCTNNILRVTWRDKKRSEEDWTRLALGTLSTLSQLSAELVGRSYGGGVLKIEPGELKSLAVPLPPLEGLHELADEVNLLLRQGKEEDATEAVNRALVKSHIDLGDRQVKRLRAARDFLFSRRSSTAK